MGFALRNELGRKGGRRVEGRERVHCVTLAGKPQLMSHKELSARMALQGGSEGWD